MTWLSLNFIFPLERMDQYDDIEDEYDASDVDSTVSEQPKGMSIVYDLPTLPAPRVPSEINAIPTDVVYTTIAELYSIVEDNSRVQLVRELLKEDPSSALAVFQVLHEMGLLRAVDQQQARQSLQGDAEVDSDDDDEDVMDTNVAPGQILPLPKGVKPDLPLGVSSWIGKGRAIENSPNQ